MEISKECLVKILDQTEEAIFVIDENHKVIYANQVAQSLPNYLNHDKIIGEKCYQRFVGRNEPCEFCKIRRFKEVQTLKRLYCDETSQRILELRGSQIDWNGNFAYIEFIRDVTKQQNELRRRFDYEMTRQEIFEEGVMERMILDLDDEIILSASNAKTKSLEQLEGLSVEELLQIRLRHVEDESIRQKQMHFFNCKNLSDSFYKGEERYIDCVGHDPATKEKRYYRITANFATNPRDGHTLAFIEAKDVDNMKLSAMLTKKLIEINYDTAVVIHKETGKIKIGIDGRTKKISTNIPYEYDELARKDILKRVVQEEQEQVIRDTSLQQVREELQHRKECSGRSRMTEDGQEVYKMWKATYFDEQEEYILLTIANITDVYKRDLKMSQDLKLALKEAEAASSAKSTFLAHMSHEIRTPITTVAGILELMRIDCEKNLLLKEELLQKIDTADTANKYLLTLINDILDMSKIENNELTISKEPTDISQVIVPLSAMIETLAQNKNIHLEKNRKTKNHDWFKMDRIRVQQILMNILSNAVKFTPVGGTISFSGERIKEDNEFLTILFTIRDTGIGISEEFKPYVFEPFKQEYNQDSDGYGGTGIGLAISKQLAILMGGDITFTSKKGEGTTFYVTLCLEKTEPVNHATTRIAVREASLEGLRILICEDNKTNQMIIRKLLEARGCIVTVANDGKEGYESFLHSAAGDFQAILMDLQMPHIDGLEATKMIRASNHKDAKKIPILAMSARAYEEDRIASLEAGMNEHLAKPVDTKRLYETLAKYCNNPN